MSKTIRNTFATAFVALTLGSGFIAASIPAQAGDIRDTGMRDGGSSTMRDGSDRGMRDGGGRGMLGGLGAGMLGGLLANAISSAYVEDSTDHNSETCIHFGACHVHIYDDGAGTKQVEIVKPPKLHRTNCAGGRCTPVKYGNYLLWTYQDANGNNYAQVTDQNQNPVNTGAPGGQIGIGGTTYSIIH